MVHGKRDAVMGADYKKEELKKLRRELAAHQFKLAKITDPAYTILGGNGPDLLMSEIRKLNSRIAELSKA
jgi:hypothetical protein